MFRKFVVPLVQFDPNVDLYIVFGCEMHIFFLFFFFIFCAGPEENVHI